MYCSRWLRACATFGQRAARAELAETEQTPIPWEQVKADLGLM